MRNLLRQAIALAFHALTVRRTGGESGQTPDAAARQDLHKLMCCRNFAQFCIYLIKCRFGHDSHDALPPDGAHPRIFFAVDQQDRQLVPLDAAQHLVKAAGRRLRREEDAEEGVKRQRVVCRF